MTDIPETLLDRMADAMLDPALTDRGFMTTATGNAVRKEVLRRALAAAESVGWDLVSRAAVVHVGTNSTRVKFQQPPEHADDF
jgi:hypothetical protein